MNKKKYCSQSSEQGILDAQVSSPGVQSLTSISTLVVGRAPLPPVQIVFLLLDPTHARQLFLHLRKIQVSNN